ncbi:MAG: HipA domain-containing protein [Desulfamplus sp.]|nr:HipA domain-containing protein [Desulfamplus sp.]
MTGRHDDLIRGFRQMVFNVMANNRDDHVKNFAFMLDHGHAWTLTPAYDLTYSQGPGGEHSMTLAGEGRAPGKDEIMQLGKGAGLSAAEIRRCVDQVRAAVDTWPECARAVGVSDERIKVIQRAVELNQRRF